MFGNGFLGGSFAGSDDHITKEREPPPRPITLEFPEYTPPCKAIPLTPKLSSRLQHKICHSRTFADVSEDDLASLNIKYTKDVSLSSFVPDSEFSSRPLLFDDDLQTMIDEISVENEDAFREVLRMPPLAGKKKPRLAYARNFFGSLEDMARFWDTGKDNYYTVSAKQPEAETSSDDERKENDSPSANKGQAREVNTDIIMNDVPTTIVKSGTEAPTDEQSKEVYKGYRLSNAEAMNPGTRIAMTKNFLKMVMHKFNCRDHEPMPAPREKFMLRGVKVQSIQYHFCVGRVPDDAKQARARFVEGPLMAVQVRDELRFKAKTGLLTPEKTGFVGEKFDLLREVGCMLILARQRIREVGRTPRSSPGPTKWWVSQPRWGGGPTKWGQLDHEVFEDDDPSWSPEEKRLQEEKRKKAEEEKAKGIDAKMAAVDSKHIAVEDLLAHGSAPSTTPSTGPIHPRKKKLRSMERPPGDDPSSMRDGKRIMYTPPFRQRWYTEWSKLRPNTSTQDDRVIYKQIGKQDRNPGWFDDIYMISIVNHHICLIKMKVHADYLEWLESGKEVLTDSADSNGPMPNVLYISRSGWYDMFDVEARKELLIAMWRVMCWINRKVVPEVEFTKMGQKRDTGVQDVADQSMTSAETQVSGR